GSDFRPEEAGAAEPGAVVSLSLAERLGGAAALVGRHIQVGANQRLKVVGVASDAQLSLADPEQTRPLAVYVNSWQYPEQQAGYPVLLLKTAGGLLPTARLRQVVDRLGREYVERAQPLDAEIDGALVENRAMAYLSGAFGVLALVLAATGLFGLLSYQVANRTGEIGIRMALGARRGQIQWLVMRQIGSLLAAGVAAGVVLAMVGGKAIAGLLFGVRAGEPRLLAAASLVLAATALAAAWLPARRAASVDPLVALRHE
ncbi:MAG TPA: FtsX-like permease family protein, partial [Candidatus Sulfopaludibacter sp.]|nr:FtsX-like permease family protein [Candidatus Sulfopaludibacter sp.]